MTAVVLLLCCAVKLETLTARDGKWKSENEYENWKCQNYIRYRIEWTNACNRTPPIQLRFLSTSICFNFSIFWCVGLFGCLCHFCYKMPGMMKRKIIEMLLLRKFSKWNYIKTICIHFHHVVYILETSKIQRTKQPTSQRFGPILLVEYQCLFPMWRQKLIYTHSHTRKIDIVAPSFARVFLLYFEFWCFCWVSILIERKLMMMRQEKKA